MSKKNKDAIIIRSNYTVKEKHKKLADKIIYERDFMTLSDFGGPGMSTFTYGNGNFKFVQSDIGYQGKKRRHNHGEWMQAADGGSEWTIVNNKLKTTSVVIDSEIPTPEYKSMLDFCYFGSAVEMVKNTLTHIINTYPGELYVTYNGYQLGNKLLGEDRFLNPVLVSNPYAIDIASEYKNNIENELRYFFKSRDKYKVIDETGKTVSCYAMWDVERWDKDCYLDGDLMAKVDLMERTVGTGETKQTLTIYQYYVNGRAILIADGDIWSGYHIRPINNVLEKYYDSLNGFEKILLNKDSNPLYTATLDYEYEDRYGIVNGKKSFTWPTQSGWNLDIETTAYARYVDELLSLATYYDERYSNNLWRMLIHESVKNLDTSVFNDGLDDDSYKAGRTQFETLMLSYGHFFDEIKREIDDIKRINEKAAYSEEGETSEHLSKSLDNKGWIVSRVTDTLNDESTVNDLYPNKKKQYDLTELNKIFLNYLNMNSFNLMRQKGTRKCIESVLGLFGLTSYDFARSMYIHLPENKKIKKNGRVQQWENLSDDEQTKFYDYKINENVVIASNKASDIIESDDELPIETYHPVMDNEDKTLGLPVKILYCTKVDNVGNVVEMKYMIPWFKNGMYHENGMYFQMYGGWEKLQSKMISQTIAPLVKEIYTGSKLTIYDETVNYLKVIGNIESLINMPSNEFHNGIIYYIEDISNIASYNTGITDTSLISNYFILNDAEYCNEISSRGWNTILNTDIENAEGNGVKVLYLESLVDDNRGNNPHVGYGSYDDGSEYFKYFRQVFKYYIDNDRFGDAFYDCTTGELLTGITSAGFTLSDLVMDNVKTWFFTDVYESPLPTLVKDIRKKKTVDGEMIDVDYGYKKLTRGKPVYVGKKGVEEDTYPFRSEMQAFNLETQEVDSYDEAAANSIMNVKNMELLFNKRISSYNGFKDYLYNVILKYLRQVIPSTTIWGVKLEAMEAEFECFDLPTIVGITDK